MTVAPQNTEDAAETPVPEGYVRATIDGFEVVVPKGELIIRSAERIGIEIPRFCDHPLLDPIGACRQCIVEVEGQRKPMTSCTTPIADGMVIKTQLTSGVADKAQKGTMELLLINHPLDCPICDKGGECPLQNQAMSNGRATSRFEDVKRTYPKPIAISSQVLLDRERCVLCARCTRFSAQVSGDPFIELFERGALEQVAIYADEPYQSYFSGNVVQICPVGALTGASYRFRSRPFDLVSTPSMCEHCASGCAQRTDWRRGKVMRRLAGNDPAVNEEWNCDKGRWAFTYVSSTDRILSPLVRDEDGELYTASWPEALERAAEGLREARDNGGGVGVLPGGRLTLEDAYAYAKFARVALGTNDIDMRARPHSDEELDFLAAHVVRSTPSSGGVSYADLEQAPAVLLVGLEPEEESPIVFLRLRKAYRKRGTRIIAVAPFQTPGLRKCGGTLLAAAPGTEPEILDALTAADVDVHEAASALRGEGAVILVGERLAAVPGGLSRAMRLAAETGAKLGWVPRRAGERGAVEAGALPNLLPGGRAVTDPAGRAEMERLWLLELPATPGRDVTGILTAARDGELTGLVVGGVDPGDLPDPVLAEQALARAGFVVSLELMETGVTPYADVVLPVAPAVHKAGTYVDWEGRERPFVETVRSVGALTDGRVLDSLAMELGADIGTRTTADTRREIAALPVPVSGRPAAPSYEPTALPRPQRGEAVLATWHLLLDLGTLQQREEHLAGTAKKAQVALSAATAEEIGAAAGEPVTVRTEHGSIALPLGIANLPDRVVWLPTNSAGSRVRRTLRADSGAVVTITAGAAAAVGAAAAAGGSGQPGAPGATDRGGDA